MPTLVEPRLDELLAFCARDAVERVFLEDVARRRLGRFSAVRGDGGLRALCHVGANVVPAGEGAAAVAGRNDVRADVAEGGQPPVRARRAEAPEAAARAVLEEDARDGILSAEREPVVELRLEHAHARIVAVGAPAKLRAAVECDARLL